MVVVLQQCDVVDFVDYLKATSLVGGPIRLHTYGTGKINSVAALNMQFPWKHIHFLRK